MTISTQIFRFPYVSTGGVTYPYTNKILAEGDLAVYVDDVLQTLTTHYTVTGVGEAAGGNVVFLVAPTSGSTVLITKDGVSITQETDYVENDAFPASSHEDALDKLTNICQKIWDYTRRSLKWDITSTMIDVSLPEPAAGQYIGWNATGTALENLTMVSMGSLSDTAYDATSWDGATTTAPSKNAIRDKIESVITDAANLVSDGTYSSATWNNVLTIAPSKNAVRDIIESVIATIIIPTFASAAEFIAGTVSNKIIAPDVMKANISNFVPLSSVRQTIQGGPVDIYGCPSTMATTTGLTLITQNVNATSPIVASSANGFGVGGEVNSIGMSITNLSWTLPDNTLSYLYVTVASGALATGTTTVLPIYQIGGTAATTSGQATYNVQEAKMYLGNGTNAPQANIVFVGEVTTSGASITAVTPYAYNGRYNSGWTNTWPAATTTITKNHNIGTVLIKGGVRIKCITAESNYATGVIVDNPETNATANWCTVVPVYTANTIKFINGSGATLGLVDSVSGNLTAMTSAKWAYELYARREF